ncbi:MAG: DnaA/Hda family protein [Bacteriovoracaceae bacterium]
MIESRTAKSNLQLLPEINENAHQLDLMGFISENPAVNIVPKRRAARAALVRSAPAKLPAVASFGYVDEKKNFANFCTSSSNHLVLETLKKFIHSEKNDFGLFFICGTPGLGKTHLLHAVANQLTLDGKSFCLAGPLLLETSELNLNLLAQYEFILIDDIDEIENKIELERLLSQLIDFAHSGKIKMIVTGSAVPQDLNNISSKLRGKLLASLAFKISKLDQPLIKDIIAAKILNLNLSLSKPIENLIYHREYENVYEIESILYKVKSLSEIYSDSLKVENILADIPELNLVSETFQKGIKDVLEIVANNFFLRVEDLHSPIRKKELALARHVAMYVMKEKMGFNVMRIAEIFSKDHSTVIYGVERIQNEVKSNSEMKLKLHQILKQMSI